MDGPRDYIVSKVSRLEKKKSYDVVYMCFLKNNGTNEIIYKIKIESQM